MSTIGSTLDSLFEELGEMWEVNFLTQKKLTQVANWDGEDAPAINPLLWDTLAEFACRVGDKRRPYPSPLPYGAVNLRWRRDNSVIDVEFDGELYTVTYQEAGAQFTVIDSATEDIAMAEVARFLAIQEKSFDDTIEVNPDGRIQAQLRPGSLPLPEWEVL